MSDSKRSLETKNEQTNYQICPHCEGMIEIAEINCGIFRHGVYTINMPQALVGQSMNPHASKAECERLVDEGLIYGCGKPLMYERNSRKLIICDYI